MANKNRQRADRFATFGERFEQAQIEAGKKVARTFGKRLQKQRLAQLGDVAARRKKAVTFRVTRRGSLVMLDMAPMAVPQEYGAILSPEEGKYLRVGLGDTRGRNPADETFVVRSKSGELLVMRKTGDGSEPVAVLKERVVIKRKPSGARFATLLDRNAQSYRDELAKALIKELDK